MEKPSWQATTIDENKTYAAWWAHAAGPKMTGTDYNNLYYGVSVKSVQPKISLTKITGAKEPHEIHFTTRPTICNKIKTKLY